ncbi:NDR1/HIN1-like protein 13 [Magnolia sinica]|uniref:NDR1/HIN1-like protein 13 n=1 Tax=Magnolia sinica TaxID=86752 RepID=UPI00265AE7E2|nr:NDR1/HIN1-like protein 13 [Magnolia sinica]
MCHDNENRQEQQGQQQQQHQHQHQHQEPRTYPRLKNRPMGRRTNSITWLIAIFCTILWVIIILGGLTILIVYLVFRPRSPQFDIASATLNAAYLDMGSFLNADLTILTNFSNPNKKVDVSFDYLVIDLYHGYTLIATTSIDPFSESRRESVLRDVHFISSQVSLPPEDRKRLQSEIESNMVMFDIKGSFRTKSKFRNFLQFSYWLHGRCSIVIGGPPTGVLSSCKCRTKR